MKFATAQVAIQAVMLLAAQINAESLKPHADLSTVDNAAMIHALPTNAELT